MLTKYHKNFVNMCKSVTFVLDFLTKGNQKR